MAAEKGKRYCLFNDSELRVRRIRADGCLAQRVAEGRCDFVMHIIDNDSINSRVIFIELKGKDLIKAVTQIFDTIAYLKNEFKQHRLDARIVGTGGVPNYKSDPEYKKLQRVCSDTKGNIVTSTHKNYSENV